MITQPSLIEVQSNGTNPIVRFAPDDINQTGKARSIAAEITQLIKEFYGDETTADGVENRELSIDMSGINVLASVGLNELINLNRKARGQGVGLILSNVQESVREIFALTRLERSFQFGVHDDLAAGSATIGS